MVDLSSNHLEIWWDLADKYGMKPTLFQGAETRCRLRNRGRRHATQGGAQSDVLMHRLAENSGMCMPRPSQKTVVCTSIVDLAILALAVPSTPTCAIYHPEVINHCWLVVCFFFLFLFFHILGKIIPTDPYFSEGLKPPTSHAESLEQDPSSAGKLVIRFHIDFPQSIPPGAGDDLEARGLVVSKRGLNHGLMSPNTTWNYQNLKKESTVQITIHHLKKSIETHLLRSPKIFGTPSDPFFWVGFSTMYIFSETIHGFENPGDPPQFFARGSLIEVTRAEQGSSFAGLFHRATHGPWLP